MTFQAMDWAIKQKLPAPQKLLLLMLANKSDEDNSTQASFKVLAELCGMGQATVKRHVGDLAARGLLRVIGRDESGSGTPNTYVLNVGSTHVSK